MLDNKERDTIWITQSLINARICIKIQSLWRKIVFPLFSFKAIDHKFEDDGLYLLFLSIFVSDSIFFLGFLYIEYL